MRMKRQPDIFNGLRYEILEDSSMMLVITVKDAYQASLQVEEKLARKKSQ
jgi:hypothetical protein